jgi:hypothetical protein
VNISDGTAIAALTIVVACFLAVCWPRRRRGVEPVSRRETAQIVERERAAGRLP